MGQVLYGSATTTEAVRRAIQNSQENLRALAQRYGINPKTVEDEAIIVAFRRHTLLPLDDCLYALQAPIPHLTHSPLIAAFNDMAFHGCPTWRTARA